MRRLFLFIILLFVLYTAWNVLSKQPDKLTESSVLKDIKTEILAIKDNPELSSLINSVANEINQLVMNLEQTVDKGPVQEEEPKPAEAEKPNLAVPDDQAFSVHNIEIGESRNKVEQDLGTPKRSSLNEYGTEWHTYHQDYRNFLMVAYDENNKVAGLYTNQNLISSDKGIKYGSTKDRVLEQLGQPLTKIRKGLVYFQFDGNRDYDMFQMDNSYVTVFYDKHQNNTVKSIQIISEALEGKKTSFYTQGSSELKEGFEYQLFDLTNADRVNHGVGILSWDDHVRETARDHSLDMAEKNYFDHTNLEGQSPFDRMLEDDVKFTVAGENLASGQFSSIFAHEGLMNSMGHRKNILRPEYKFLGVGVAFNSESQPYYTENFFTK